MFRCSWGYTQCITCNERVGKYSIVIVYSILHNARGRDTFYPWGLLIQQVLVGSFVCWTLTQIEEEQLHCFLARRGTRSKARCFAGKNPGPDFPSKYTPPKYYNYDLKTKKPKSVINGHRGSFKAVPKRFLVLLLQVYKDTLGVQMKLDGRDTTKHTYTRIYDEYVTYT